MSLQSTVGVAKVGTKSLRATVPEGIVAYLNLQVGNKLDWRMEIMDGEKVVLVRKIQNEALEMRVKDKVELRQLKAKYGKSSGKEND